MGRTSRDKRDIYYRLAKTSNYRARAAFKLLQLDATLGILSTATTHDGLRVADLCAAPGGWSQVVAERRPGARVVAVDLKPIAPSAGVEMVLGDITAAATAREVVDALGGGADARRGVFQRPPRSRATRADPRSCSATARRTSSASTTSTSTCRTSSCARPGPWQRRSSRAAAARAAKRATRLRRERLADERRAPPPDVGNRPS